MPSSAQDPWSDQSLLATLANYAGAGDDVDQAEPVRFLRGVARLVKKRLGADSGQALLPAIFLLCPTPPASIDPTVWQPHPMLDNGLTSVTGRLWLVSPLVVFGQSMPLEAEDDAGIFDFVVNHLGQGEVPAVIYDPRTHPAQIRYYSDGLKNVESCETVVLPVELIELSQVFDLVDHVHRTTLVTPDGQMAPLKLWQDADRHWPMSSAELRIQTYLKMALCVRFPTCTIRCEQQQVTGRLDIEIEGVDPERPGWFIRYVILELKVLRSYGETGNSYSEAQVIKWIHDGVEQAYAYRIDRGSLDSALCCFDMRKVHDSIQGIADINQKANSLGVTIKFWPLYSSSGAYRAYLAANN